MDTIHRLLTVLPTAGAALSFLLYIPTLPKNPDQGQGKIALPDTSNGHVNSNGKGKGKLTNGNGYRQIADGDDDEDEEEYYDGFGSEKKRDPFELEDETIEVDGYPLNEEGFWRKTYYQKIAFFLLLLPATLANLFALGWYLAISPTRSWSTLLSLSMPIPLNVYLLLLSIQYLTLYNVPQHWSTTIHLSSVTFLAWFCEVVSVILPDSDNRGNNDIFNPTPGTGREMKAVQILMAIKPLTLLPAFVILVGFIRRGPMLHFPVSKLFTPKVLGTLQEEYAEKTPVGGVPEPMDPRVANVNPEVNNTVVEALLFTYAEPVMRKGNASSSFNVWDLPLMTVTHRALNAFREMKHIYGDTRKLKRFKQRPGLMGWVDKLPEGYNLLAKVFIANKYTFTAEIVLAVATAALYYTPAYFLRQLLVYLEEDSERQYTRKGWVWCFGLFASNVILYIATGMLWSVASTLLQTKIKLQLSTLLFSKALIKKDLASTPKTEKTTPIASALAGEAGLDTAEGDQVGEEGENKNKETGSKPGGAKEDEEDEEDVSSKTQVMTLFTVDVDRVSDFTFHAFSLIDAPIEIVVGSYFLYQLLGVSAFVGLAASLLTLPINHYASGVIVNTQDQLMKARDKRTSLIDEILGGIRMVKFLAFERKFEQRVNTIREEELKYLRRNWIIEVVLNLVWNLSPILVTLVTFTHYVLTGHSLTPGIVFPAASVLNELKFSLSAIPETAISVLQGFVSLRRIQKYMSQAEVVPGEGEEDDVIAMRSATLTWPRDVASGTASGAPSAVHSAVNTPNTGFTLADVNVEFPPGELSLICGRLGSGKTLLLLGLLGEADILTGQVICPRSPPDAMDSYGTTIRAADWILSGRTAYAPQVAWLQNASIRDNIIFGSPVDEDRLQRVVEACSLTTDLAILDDGIDTEVGEKGLNLSGGQKARVSLARAVYSRAATVILDDIIAALDAHTTKAILDNCLKGELMQGRTVILVSHHIQLLAPAASYIVALDNGDVLYAGDQAGFVAGGHMREIEADIKAEETPAVEKDEQDLIDAKADNKLLKIAEAEPNSETSSITEVGTEGGDTAVEGTASVDVKKKAPRKLVEDEVRQTGSIAWKTWKTYLNAQGAWLYWMLFIISVLVGATPPIWENYVLSRWSNSYTDPSNTIAPTTFLIVYAIVTSVGAIIGQIRFGILYLGSMTASRKIHKTMLERVLFATIRFHDTSVRGRVLNRFGKDMEGLDSNTADNFGRTMFYFLNVAVTFGSITWVGGWRFALASVALAGLYYQAASFYGQTSRDLRRLDSTSRSPLYATFSEVISGVQVIRAFGASVSTLRTMCQIADSNVTCFFWNWTLNRWVSARFNMLSSAIVGGTGVIVLVTPTSAALAGFALTFALGVSGDLLFVARRYVALTQSMVAIERLDEYCNLPQEAAEYIEGSPPAAWPTSGSIEIRDLVIRYAPDLPAVLHKISLSVGAREKVGIVGATGCGKSTLAMSLFRFVEPSEGQILVDGVDITNVGLSSLRQNVTLIAQDPTILSGTLRTTLDTFEEYEDSEIYESLRRVHLLRDDEASGPSSGGLQEGRNKNVFTDLNSPVSEGGDNFSQGEKQLICMARAILRRNKVLVMDEATASIDYETDELISKTIREEFGQSTILTIAHRLATVITYDKILLMDRGNILEFDSPFNLLQNHKSRFYSLCKASGKAEFRSLQAAATEAHQKRKTQK